jgi:hypothetical protein
MSFAFRRAEPNEIQHCAHLYSCDRSMLSPDMWRRFPDLLRDLLERERILLALVHEPATNRRRMLGGSAFVDPDFLTQALEHPTDSLLQQVLTAEAAGRSVLLSPKRQAIANARTGLCLYNFLTAPDLTGVSGPDGNLLMGLINEAWRFHHYGFRLHSLHSEGTHPGLAEFMLSMQCTLARERNMPNGDVARTFRFTREDALAKPGTNVGIMFIAPLPRFGFTLPEQKLIELTLMDNSDREISRSLGITADAVKKRWRSIYDRVRAIAPELLAVPVSGADQRRALLQYLRQHLEEIRPYDRTTPAG